MDKTPMQELQPYTYDHLVSSNSIRLFNLHAGSWEDPIVGNLRQAHLSEDDDSVPAYTALSYTWGSPRGTCLPITIDDRRVFVRDNLFGALQALRDTRISRTYWIDALCISQENVYEKNHQVGMMARIYRAAQNVKVWLGRADEKSSLAFRYMQDFDVDCAKAAVEPRNASVEAITAVLQRDYWSRSWIVQEVSLARSIDLHCGTARLAWAKFADTCTYLEPYLPKANAIELIKRRNAIENDELVLLDQTLEALIRTYSTCECSDRRDRVFALLSLASDCVSSQNIVADYRLSRFELLVRVLEFCRSTDPVALASLLFQSFSKEEGDEAWHKALSEWTKGRLSPPAFNSLLKASAEFANTRLIRITHFVAALSPSRDWVRQYSTTAILDLNHIKNSRNDESSLLATIVHRNAEPPTAEEFDDSVFPIDGANVAILLHRNHIVILSTAQITAVVNYCYALGFHEDHRGCTRAQCSKFKALEDTISPHFLR